VKGFDAIRIDGCEAVKTTLNYLRWSFRISQSLSCDFHSAYEHSQPGLLLPVNQGHKGATIEEPQLYYAC
jgi:hypothetical protein